MADNTYTQTITELSGGINIDVDPSVQPKNSRRFTLNTVEQDSEGIINLSNEPSDFVCATFPSGFIPIGDRYIGNGNTFVILVNPTSDLQDLGLIDSTDRYTSLVNTGVLGLKITHQCEIKFRVRRGNERVVYWVDGLNVARTFNLDRVYNFYNTSYQFFLNSGGNPDDFIGDKWDVSSFDLIKSYSSVPTFEDVEVLEYGSILPGSYNFAIQYVDEDLNPTEWITTSNTVNIYNDSIDVPYERIRGSRNVKTDSQSFPRANKTIKLTISSLDNSFPYYRVAIIRAAGNTGIPDKVLASDLVSTSENRFIYAGNDANLSEVNIADILIGKEVIFAPRHIEQLENRLLLLHTKGKGINWCEFQKYASQIKSDFITKEVILNSVYSEPNVKAAKSTFQFRGYMPGEVYSFGICYLFADGYISPVCHIPGHNEDDTNTEMLYHELPDNKYIDIHNCIAGNYWGQDNLGESLVGKPIRHHRFPFRHQVNKTLVNRTSNTTNINKYKLTVVITLNPDYTPPPNEYPIDDDDEPLVIPYTFHFQINGAATEASYTGSLVDTDVERERIIVLYDSTTPLDEIDTDVYSELDEDSELATYQDGVNDRFLITEEYDEYVVDSVQNTDKSRIFGIEFSNIEKPHPDVVGFYIVRNERLDDDRIILDNAIFGTMTEFEQYKSFSTLMPKQFYEANNCGIEDNSGKTLEFSTNSLWFFNPEHQYFQKRFDFDSVEVEGVYNEDSYQMPTISNVEGSECNNEGSKGVYIDDVQAGTSYDPELNKEKDKDDDGFDLIIGYRNYEVEFDLRDNIHIPDKDTAVYLNAASYYNQDDNTYYNVSVDNKIGVLITEDDFNISLVRDTDENTNRLLYGALVKNNTTSYSNFINRPYFKEHNNPVLFGDSDIINGVEVYNGDAEISAFNFVSSVFYDMVVADRAKKSGLWKIITGAVLVVAAIVLTATGVLAPLGVAIGAAGVTALTTLAISYGVSLLVSGINFEQYKSMIEVDYEKGLKDTVVDGGVYETVREDIERADDTIRWFADRISNIYIESAVPFGLRSGLTCGVSDFVDAPAVYDEPAFRTYLTEKLTSLDRDQGAGRLYKGYASAEVYDMNLDYMRFNKQKEFIHLPLEYDCCYDFNEVFPRRVWWSEQSFQEEKIDNYRVFLPNNYADIEGEHGEITGVYRLGNNLFIHTAEGLWQLPQSQQERVTNEIVSFVGTGSLFSVPPRKVLDDELGSGGTKHKWATVKTPAGVVSLSETEHAVYLHSNTPKKLSNDGVRTFFEENARPFLVTQLYNSFGILFPNYNNPANINGVGYLSTYDSKRERVLITKKDYLLLPDKLDSLSITSRNQLSTSTGIILYGYNGVMSGASRSYADTDVLTAIGSLGDTTIMRYPGGTVANSFDWETGLDDSPNPSDLPNTLDDIAALYNTLGYDILFNLNLVTKTLANQLEMLNSAHALGIPIKYVELGNEMGSLSSPQHTAYPTANAYADTAAIWMSAIKAQFPDCKVVFSGENRGWSPNWNDIMIAKNPDGIVWHIGPDLSRFYFDGVVDFDALDTALEEDFVSTGMSAVSEVPIWPTEFNYNYDAANLLSEEDAQAVTLAIIRKVSELIELNNPDGLKIMCVRNIEGDKQGALIIGKHNITRRATGYAMEEFLSEQVVVEPPVESEDSNDFTYNVEDGQFYQGSNIVPFTNRDYFEDKSWTMSYSFKSGKWVSWHSYMPNFYVHSKDKVYLYTCGSDNLWKQGTEGQFQTFFGVYYPHIIEGVLRAADLKDAVFEDILFRCKARWYDSVRRNFLDKRYITFNKGIFYNDRQCSGEMTIEVDDDTESSNWYTRRTSNGLGVIKASRVGRDWTINGFRDYVTHHDEAMFTSEWDLIRASYYIDKVVNKDVTSFRKRWQDLESFRDKYIIFRLKFDNFDSINLITSYSLTTQQASV